MEIKLTAENFEREVVKSDLPILVDFWADWCGPCHAVAPVLTELAGEFEGRVRFGKLNVDEHPEIAQRYQIASIPNMKIFKKGEIADEIVGVNPKEEIKSRLEKQL